MARADIAITELNREFEITGKRQWVLTPQPDLYIVCAEVNAAQAEVFGCDTGRVACFVQVQEDGSGGIMAVIEIDENNQQSKELLLQYPGEYPAEVCEVLDQLEDTLHGLVVDFLDEVGPEALEIHYAIQRAEFGEKTVH